MNTEICKITEKSLKRAVELLKDDKLVAFPTETVYGLGANAFSDEAIKNVYLAKGRPSDNPLIVHVHKDYNIDSLVYDTEIAKKLRKAFLPGPLTMVYKSKGKISKFVSCGLDTLALRVPSLKSAQRFLEFVNLPIAAPSANISKHISPVTALHVFNDFNNKIELILDGGRAEGGIESTVLDVTGEIPVILRKGLITAQDVIKVCGSCVYAEENSSLNARSPGTKYKHYSPNVETEYFLRSNLNQAIDLYNNAIKQGKKPYFICDEKTASQLDGYNLFNLGENGRQMASSLYYYLHEAERLCDLLIAVELLVVDDVVLSVNNRFLKAFAK